MFKTTAFAAALVAVVRAGRYNQYKADPYVKEWEGPKKDLKPYTAYGVDNQHYGHQKYDTYGEDDGYGSYGNKAFEEADNHNSHRQTGHQGQGHNQWTDNAWNQWGTNNHFDTQKSVDNKWGNNSGKVNYNYNSVNGHYDSDYGQQKRGIGYEGHQNTSGETGFTIGLDEGHSFDYEEGDHSYGYDNEADFGYGGWANNLGAFNHGANYDNFGNQHHDGGRDITNDARDTADVKQWRQVSKGYADVDELDQDDDRQNQYGRYRYKTTGEEHGTGHRGKGAFSKYGDNEWGAVKKNNLGYGVTTANYEEDEIYDQHGYEYPGDYSEDYSDDESSYGHRQTYGHDDSEEYEDSDHYGYEDEYENDEYDEYDYKGYEESDDDDKYRRRHAKDYGRYTDESEEEDYQSEGGYDDSYPRNYGYEGYDDSDNEDYLNDYHISEEEYDEDWEDYDGYGESEHEYSEDEEDYGVSEDEYEDEEEYSEEDEEEYEEDDSYSHGYGYGKRAAAYKAPAYKAPAYKAPAKSYRK